MEKKPDLSMSKILIFFIVNLACVASVSVLVRSKERGARVKDRAKNGTSTQGGGGEESIKQLYVLYNTASSLCESQCKLSHICQEESKNISIPWFSKFYQDRQEAQNLNHVKTLLQLTVRFSSCWNSCFVQRKCTKLNQHDLLNFVQQKDKTDKK